MDKKIKGNFSYIKALGSRSSVLPGSGSIFSHESDPPHWFNRRVEKIIVLIIEGNSVIGARERSNLCYLICLRQLIRSRAVRYRLFFSPERPISFMLAQYVLSYLLI